MRPPEPAPAGGRGEPRRVEIHLGTLCNNRCVFCMSGVLRDRKEPWAGLETVRRELEFFYRKGCRAAGFLGGEPTVHPRILEAIACARELGYRRISLCTNGTRLSDPGFCRSLVDAGLTRVTLSVHSHRPEVEDRLVTRVPGNFARKVAAVENLVALRRRGRLADNLSLNPVLSRPGLREMPSYLRFFGDLGVDDVRFNFIWPAGEAAGDRGWVPSLAEAAPEILRVILRNERLAPIRLSFGGVPRCALRLAGVSGRLLHHLAAKYLDEAGFDPDNDVSLAGGGRPQDRFVWQRQKRDVLKARGPACRECRHRDACDGVWRTYADLYGFGELSPL